MDEPEILTATEASRAFSELLHRVCYGRQSFVIKKGNRLMARIVPVEEVEQPESAPQVNVSAPEVENNEALLEGLTQEEADYYKTVVEQMRKTVFEPSD